MDILIGHCLSADNHTRLLALALTLADVAEMMEVKGLSVALSGCRKVKAGQGWVMGIKSWQSCSRRVCS